ncbi:MAG: hypothetical protein GYA21_00075 [Myxococcales bacterium]|nr:hypothetical protein [Myxococcales bacterium]
MRAMCWRSGWWFALALVACASEAPPRLYLDLLPLTVDGRDPVAESHSFAVVVEGGKSYDLGGFERTVAFGEIATGGEARLQVFGRDLAGERVAWGFSEPVPLAGGDRQAVVGFTSDAAALAHAGPALVDPQASLLATGVPRSLGLDEVSASLAFNRAFLFVEVEVPDGSRAPFASEWWKGDGLVVVLDGLRDSAAKSWDGNDVVFFLGRDAFAIQWPAGQPNILHRAREQTGGYAAFAAVPWSLLGGVVEAGRELRLGLEWRDADDSGAVQARRWPRSWNPDPDGHDPPVHYPDGSGTVRLRTRTLDARRIRGPVDDFFAPGRRLSDVGAQPLSLRLEPGADAVEVYATWDGSGLLLLVESQDRVVCAQRRSAGDRDNLLRDDAVELVLAPGGGPPRRALINLSGDTAFDQLGGGAWNPVGMYFGFEFSGPAPDNDCREAAGYLFKARLPWTDLGFVTPPESGAVLGLDLNLYDNDRGAHLRSSFCPLGPAQLSGELAELRLVDFW